MTFLSLFPPDIWNLIGEFFWKGEEIIFRHDQPFPPKNLHVTDIFKLFEHLVHLNDLVFMEDFMVALVNTRYKTLEKPFFPYLQFQIVKREETLTEWETFFDLNVRLQRKGNKHKISRIVNQIGNAQEWKPWLQKWFCFDQKTCCISLKESIRNGDLACFRKYVVGFEALQVSLLISYMHISHFKEIIQSVSPYDLVSRLTVECLSSSSPNAVPVWRWLHQEYPTCCPNISESNLRIALRRSFVSTELLIQCPNLVLLPSKAAQRGIFTKFSHRVQLQDLLIGRAHV